jgi:hypothetical protein
MIKERRGRTSTDVPNLIYALEQHERFLSKLAQRTGLNLLRGMRRATARDFRISDGALQEALLEDSAVDEVRFCHVSAHRLCRSLRRRKSELRRGSSQRILHDKSISPKCKDQIIIMCQKSLTAATCGLQGD